MSKESIVSILCCLVICVYCMAAELLMLMLVEFIHGFDAHFVKFMHDF